MNEVKKRITIQITALAAALIAFLALNYYFNFIPLDFKFLSEKIHLVAGEKNVEAMAEFSFKNKTNAYKNITLFYPFYLKDGVGYPQNLKVFKIVDGSKEKKEIYPFEQFENGISVNLNFDPREIVVIRIEFDQAYNGNFYKFILGGNRAWLQKIGEGCVTVETGARVPARIIPAMREINGDSSHCYQLKRLNYFDDGIEIRF